ncbi:hypothetical protein BRC81_05550 [Halobacteriales archaeon QS_1_68_20]|nr:MAG: hypothetical protein BRC81_05550 [Halobacteriales archaeon QS_1_68_20]
MSPTETDGLESTAPMRDRVSDYTVVDVDVHEQVSMSEFRPYLEEPWASRIEHLVRTDEPIKQSFVGSLPFELDPVPGGALPEGVSPSTPGGMQQFMEFMNTDYVLLHGEKMLGVSRIPEREFAMALCRAYNDFVLEEFTDDNDGLKSTIWVPPQAPRQAAEEIDRLADEKDMVGVHVTCATNEWLLGNSYYDPLFRAAADAGLPVTYHPGYPSNQWAGEYGAPGTLQSSVADRTAGFSQQIMSQVASLVYQGVPERYPDLEHVFLEAGVTWIPWMLGRLDKNYDRRGHQLEWLETRPSESVKDLFYFDTQPLEDPAGDRNLRRIFRGMDAEDLLMYSSDYPHFDVDYPSVLAIPKMSDRVERAIFGGNALEVFDV